MRISLALLLFFFVLGVISCQKEISGDFETIPEANDTLLKKIIVWDSLLPKENINHLDFTYDNQQRVVKIKRYFIDSVNTSATIRDEDSTVFHYTGNEKRPFKSVGYTRLTYLTDTEIFHRYDAAGRLAADSVNFASIMIVRRYTYHTGYIKAVEEDQIPGVPTFYLEDSFVVSNNNNFTQAFFAVQPGNGPIYFEDTYDNKINPLHKLNIANTQIEGELAYDKLIFLSPGYCPNNITGRKSSISYPLGNPHEVQTYQFTYNTKGYPVSGKMTSNYSTSEDTRIRFIYGK